MRPVPAHSDALRAALAHIERIAPHVFRYRPPKTAARQYLRKGEDILINGAFPIIDRWFQRKYARHPMAQFIYGSTFEEPRRGVDGLGCVRFLPKNPRRGS